MGLKVRRPPASINRHLIIIISRDTDSSEVLTKVQPTGFSQSIMVCRLKKLPMKDSPLPRTTSVRFMTTLKISHPFRYDKSSSIAHHALSIIIRCQCGHIAQYSPVFTSSHVYFGTFIHVLFYCNSVSDISCSALNACYIFHTTNAGD